MDFTGLLDATASYTDNVGPASGDRTTRRARHATYGIRAFNYVYLYREWWFRRASPTVTVAAGANFAVLPASFMDVGYKGGVYAASTGRRLDHVDPKDITDLREGTAPYITDDPLVYSIFGQDATTRRPLFQLPQTVSALTFKAWSDTAPPTLDEGANVANLKVIPESWHELVLVPAVRAIAQESKADARYRTFTEDPTFRAGLNLMCIREKHGKDTPKRAPSFFGREY